MLHLMIEPVPASVLSPDSLTRLIDIRRYDGGDSRFRTLSEPLHRWQIIHASQQLTKLEGFAIPDMSKSTSLTALFNRNNSLIYNLLIVAGTIVGANIYTFGPQYLQIKLFLCWMVVSIE